MFSKVVEVAYPPGSSLTSIKYCGSCQATTMHQYYPKKGSCQQRKVRHLGKLRVIKWDTTLPCFQREDKRTYNQRMEEGHNRETKKKEDMKLSNYWCRISWLAIASIVFIRVIRIKLCEEQAGVYNNICYICHLFTLHNTGRTNWYYTVLTSKQHLTV